MKTNPPISNAAYSRLELVVVIATVILLVGFVLPSMLRKNGRNQPRTRCIHTLKNIGAAYRIYSIDNNDLFPGQRLHKSKLETEYFDDPLKYYRLLTNELSNPGLLTCPNDKRKKAETWSTLTRENISYFNSPDARELLPRSFLAGDRNLTTDGANLPSRAVKLSAGAKLDWNKEIHQQEGNICRADGSVHSMNGERLREQSKRTDLANFTVVIP